jgi:hypothetical protein
MRHLLASTVVLATAATASAQPVTRPEWGQPRPEMRAEMCGVTFVRAPDDVRYAIERYLRDEPRCTSSIELRVVPTDGGYYLLAQRPDGRIHERLVPDLQSAGVLVASWVADDWTAPADAYAPPPAPSAPLTVIVDPLRVGAPGAVGIAASAAPADPKWHKWLSLGLIVQPDNEGGGFRFEADLISSGAWRVGGVLSYTEHHDDMMLDGGGWASGTINAQDIEVMAQLSRTATWGRWDLRGALGAGMINTDAMFWGETVATPGFTSYQASKTFLVGEASAMLTRRLGRSWGFGLGPVITLLDESFSDDSISGKMERRKAQVEIFGGLRYEL